MSIPRTPLDGRIFTAKPAASHALAVELLRNPRAVARRSTPLASSRLGARSSVPGHRRRDDAPHRDPAAGTPGVAGNPGPASMTK
ncbi:hypothetical protein ACIPVK_02210 [Paeniglutamicibacter sp. MACA_103]|uniref:hypothetical protein n=1 Tax=Paeniglutamicibacter sp. MACA_103 TaxID=3377337 RepID=UPI003895D854